jgi:hypothetical protein
MFLWERDARPASEARRSHVLTKDFILVFEIDLFCAFRVSVCVSCRCADSLFPVASGSLLRPSTSRFVCF